MIQLKSLRYRFKHSKIAQPIFYAILILIFVFFVQLIAQKGGADLNGNIVDSIDKEGWKTYINEQYQIAIDFPADWEVYEDFSNANPSINIYKPKFKIPELPLDHFDDIANVSIFPNGVMAGNVIGQSSVSNEKIIEEGVERQTDYLLQNKDVWATMITFKKPPEVWKEWGFIWMRTEVVNQNQSCFKSGIEIEIEKCNLFGGDEFIRTGKSNNDIYRIEKEIVKTFRFTE